MSDEEPRDGSKSLEAVAGAIAGAAGLAVEGPASALVSAAAAPYVLDIVRRSWDEITVLRQGSVASLVATAAEELGEDAQTLVDGAMSSDGGAELLAEAMHAAAATLNQRKVDALARALANGLAQDQVQIDDARLMVQSLADVEAPHIKVLVALLPYRLVVSVDPETIAERLEVSEATVRTIFVTLERVGFIEENLAEQQQALDKHNRERIENEMRRLPNSGRQGPVIGLRYETAPRITRKWSITEFGVEALEHLGISDPRDEDE
jgi:predicted transcriptional regulator